MYQKYFLVCIAIGLNQIGCDMSEIRQYLSELDQIGAIGSPSTTSELSVDILGVAADKKLVGELALFHYLQDSLGHFAIGQITEVELKNIWLEDATMRSLARQKGTVNPVSGMQDTHLGKMTISAVFAKNNQAIEPSMLGTVPATGTYLYVADDNIINKLLAQYRDEIFYLGNVYGSNALLPLWFKHFGSGRNGAGEAYHLGVFGKTGSGKSVLAKLILTAYSNYQDMALLVIDPQGEFSKDLSEKVKDEDGFNLPLKTLLERNGKETVAISIKNLVLDTWELFSNILFESPFFERLTMPKGENRQIACDLLTEELRKAKVKLTDLLKRTSFDKAWEIFTDEKNLDVIYRSPTSRERLKNKLEEVDKNHFYNKFWSPVAELFSEEGNGRRKIDKALYWLLDISTDNRPNLIIDLSREKAQQIYWNDKIQSLVIKQILSKLNRIAEYHYQEGKNLNSLVVIDEAHRLAPREVPEDDVDRAVRSVLIDAARTTRKYGLGWMFISQTLSSLHREIINQLRINFFGFGLSMGSEFRALKEIAGGDKNSLKLYQSFRDPHSAFDISSRQYSFMTTGPVSPLSFAGTPLFFSAFNTVEKFLDKNDIDV